MRLIAPYPLLCVGIALLAMAGFAVGQGDHGSVLVAALLAVVSWFVTEGPRGRTLPRWAGGILVFAVGGMLVIDLLATPGALPIILGRFTLWVLVIKLYERRTARDHAHILSLSLLLLLVGCMTPNPPFALGVIVVLSGAMMLYAVLLHQLYAAHERLSSVRRRGGAPAEAMTIGSVQPTCGPGFDRHFRRLAGAVGGAVFIASFVFFLLLPRGIITALPGATGRLGGTGSQTTGFVDEVRLLSGTRITTSRRPVMELRITDERGIPWRSAETLLVRGNVLSLYRNGVWVEDESSMRSINMESEVSMRIGDVADPGSRPKFRQDFRFERPVRRIFALGRPVRLESDRAQGLRLQVASGALSVHAPGAGLQRYTVYSRPGSTIERFDGEPVASPSARTGFADPSFRGVDKVRALMHEILTEARVPLETPDPRSREAWLRQAGRAVERWMSTDRFRYTLDLSDVMNAGEDPTLQFLFETRRGHCEFFASGFAALFQSIGEEARLAIGYAVRRWDPERQLYLVDESAAHAWVELHAGDGRWLVFDPTPAAALPPPSPTDPAFTDRFGRFYSMVEGAWQQHFVGYDDQMQSRLLGSLDRSGSGTITHLVNRARQITSDINLAFRFGVAGYIWMAVVAFLLLCFLVVGLRFLVRWRAFRRLIGPERMSLAQVRRRIGQVGFYPQMLQLLTRSGAEKPHWRTPMLHAHAMATDNPQAAALVQSLTDRFYAIRFGGREDAERDAERTRRELEALKHALSRPSGGSSEQRS